MGSVTRKGIGYESDPVRRPGSQSPGSKLVSAQRCREAVRIEHGVTAEHEIDRPSELDGDHGIGLEFVPLHAGLQPLSQRTNYRVIAFGDHGGFAEGPPEIRVAELGTSQAFDFAGTGHRAFDQAAVGQEVLNGWEALNLTNLAENGHPQVLTNTWNGFEEFMLFLPPWMALR